MDLTTRQRDILEKIVKDYIRSAQPVSSQMLEERYDFGIRPAAIRIEMRLLGRKGYLSKVHISSGRIPTDKGYRFFVNELIGKGLEEENFREEFSDVFTFLFEDSFKFIQLITKKLAQLSSDFVLTYLPEEKIVLKEGWEEVIQKPEFKEEKIRIKFIQLLKNFEENLEKLEIVDSDLKIYIGEESPFAKIKEFSIIYSPFHFRSSKVKEKGIVSILGPKRMSYEKNISLLRVLTKSLENPQEK
jgi:transcriptional regulator of heat shock response